MASTLAVLLLLSACLFTTPVGGYDCRGYFDRNGDYTPPKSCGFLEHCCGTCDDRYCCSSAYDWLSQNDQNLCSFNKGAAIGMAVVGFVIFVIVIIVCCFWPRSYIYKMYRQRRPAVTTQVTTVTNMQNIQQQPAVQGVQYPQYQPVPTPMQMGPYQGQQCAPGPPPTYQVAPNPVYPTQQNAYDGGQAMYPMQPPAQPGVAYMHSETSSQPPYNPAYMQPPNTDY